MKINQLIGICVAASFLLSGCGARFGLGRGGGKITIPFDPPYDRAADENEETAGTLNQS